MQPTRLWTPQAVLPLSRASTAQSSSGTMRWWPRHGWVHSMTGLNVSADGALVETVADGWWYSATLPGQRAVAMFLTDADLFNWAEWDDRLARAPATRARLASGEPPARAAVRAANSQRSTIVTGAGWVAAGDAAAAFDPISSLGIGFSFRSGMEAARVAAAAAEHDDGPAAAYAASITRIYADYRSRLTAIYRREGRWPEAPGRDVEDDRSTRGHRASACIGSA